MRSCRSKFFRRDIWAHKQQHFIMADIERKGANPSSAPLLHEGWNTDARLTYHRRDTHLRPSGSDDAFMRCRCVYATVFLSWSSFTQRRPASQSQCVPRHTPPFVGRFCPTRQSISTSGDGRLRVGRALRILSWPQSATTDEGGRQQYICVCRTCGVTAWACQDHTRQQKALGVR